MYYTGQQFNQGRTKHTDACLDKILKLYFGISINDFYSMSDSERDEMVSKLIRNYKIELINKT